MSNYTHVLLIVADGARCDVFGELVERGDMPYVSRHLVERGTYSRAVTAFPSVTGVAYAPILTGLYPGHANIPGLRWFDRYAYGRSVFSLMRQRNYYGYGSYLMDRDLTPRACTLFEHFDQPVNIYSGISRGTGILGNRGYFKRIPYIYYFVGSRNWDPIENLASKRRGYLPRALRDGSRFILRAVMAIDEYSHFLGSRHPRVLNAYRLVDQAVGDASRILRARGVWERTLVIITSDHGHGPVQTHFDAEGYVEGLGLKTMCYPRVLRNWRGAEAACMVSGNAMAHIYFPGRKGWDDRPTNEEIERRHPRLIPGLVEEPAVDLVAGVTEGGVIKVLSRRGTGYITRELNGPLEGDGGQTFNGRRTFNGRLRYWTENGDPFGYSRLPEYMTFEESLRLTFATDYPDALVQLWQIFRSPRCGDLVLSAAPGCDLRSRGEGRHLISGHGSLHRDHMLVPFLINRPLAPPVPDRPIRTVDICPTVLALTGREPPRPIDGRYPFDLK